MRLRVSDSWSFGQSFVSVEIQGIDDATANYRATHLLAAILASVPTLSRLPVTTDHHVVLVMPKGNRVSSQDDAARAAKVARRLRDSIKVQAPSILAKLGDLLRLTEATP